MTTLPTILVNLRVAADRTLDLALTEKVRNAADEIERAVVSFDPTVGDFPAWLRDMVATLASAQRLYADATGKVLVPIVTTPPAALAPPPEPVKLRGKVMSHTPWPSDGGDVA